MKRVLSATFCVLAISLAGCRVADKFPTTPLDPESRKFYQSARLIMSSEESKIFSRLQDAASRREFIEDFWAKRDPDPYTEGNEFKQEFEARVAYANKRFKEGGPGMNTDRGRIYIYMGPPDKFEEYPIHDDPEVRGPVLYWIYYEFELVIEFADERGDGQFRIRRTEGDFFRAMEGMKLGDVTSYNERKKRKFTDFELTYDSVKKEFVIVVPAKAFAFKTGQGLLKADLDLDLYIYGNDGKKVDRFQKSQSVERPESERGDAETLTFAVPYELQPGRYYVDAIIIGREESLTKSRKIFEIKF